MAVEKIITKSAQETEAFAQKLARKIKSGPLLILLRGPLGAGKTQWTRGFVRRFIGPKALVSSPTYSLVNIYGNKKKSVHHVDLYRLKDRDDLESIGFWDFLEGQSVVIVEWGDMLPPDWPDLLKVFEVDFEILSESERQISWREIGRLKV